MESTIVGVNGIGRVFRVCGKAKVELVLLVGKCQFSGDIFLRLGAKVIF